jgi:ribosomal protein S27E
MMTEVEYIQVKCFGGGKWTRLKYVKEQDTFVTLCSHCGQVVEAPKGRAASHMTRVPK